MITSTPQPVARFLAMCIVLTLLAPVTGFASAQPRSITAFFVQEAKLTASDGAAEDDFGNSVAISGNTLVVGAMESDGNDEHSGSAYVFERDEGEAGNWEQVAKLTASDGAPLDWFGWSVSIDGNTVVVGARWHDGNGSGSGAAYLFEKPGSSWSDMTETAKLTASDGAHGDSFGVSVSVSGDAVVVGAYWDDDSGESSGSAYLFEEPGSGWTNMIETVKLTASDGAAGDWFGWSVSISGETVVVGAFQDDDRGSSYVYEKPAAGWSEIAEVAKLTPSNGDEWHGFGTAVSISDETAVVGDTGSRTAYVYERPIAGWIDMTETAKLTASDGAAGDSFGRSVSISGDRVVVGAYYDDDNGDESGSVYLYEKPEAGWIDMAETLKLTAVDGATGDFFGVSVSSDDETVLAGAPSDDDNGDNSGSAYVFVPWEPVARVYLPVVLRTAP